MATPLSELLDESNSAWPQVESWCATARNEVKLLRASGDAGDGALLRLQVTTRSPMGAITHHCEGLVVDRGWVRVLGAGGDQLKGGICEWNGLAEEGPDPKLEGGLVVAHDVVGGFFAVNGGAWPGKPGSVHYFGPDSLSWLDLNAGYSEWLQWLLGEDLSTFYGKLRWAGWESEIHGMSPDQGFTFYPFLWAKGERLDQRRRSKVPMLELWSFNWDVMRQLANTPDGQAVRIDLTD